MDLGGDVGGGKKTTGIPDILSSILHIPLETTKALWAEHKENVIKGEEMPKEFLIHLKELLHIDFDVERVFLAWEQQYFLKKEHINWDVVEYIESLKGKYAIHLLTDAIDLRRGDAPWIARIDKCFDTAFRSYEQKMKKPDKEAYINVLEKLHANPEECVFVDDVRKNVEAAKDVGMHVVLFTDFLHMKQQFQIYGIG